MAITVRNDILQLDAIRDIFQDTLKELFTNPATCEEAEFHYFSIEKSEDREFIYYDGDLLPTRVLQNKTPAGYKQLIKEYIQDTLEKDNYILEESDIYFKDERLKKVFWVFFSECLVSNHGKLLLKCVFQELTDLFNQYLKGAVNSVQRCDRGYASVIQKVLQDAETQMELYVQELFAPLNIDFIDNISGQYYEKSDCKSNMIFLSDKAAKYVTPEDFLYCFAEIKFLPSNNRLIRKLLQIAQNNLYLVLEADEGENLFHVVGICTKSVLFQKLKPENKMAVPYIKVNIKTYMQWDIFLGDTYIFTSKNGHYKVDRELQKEFMVKKLLSYFGETKVDCDGLFETIQMSTKQTHGTMLVIMESETARDEVKRLGEKQYGLPEHDFQWQKNGVCDKQELIRQEINNLNAVDGCVIFGTDGKLYGIGMILDGIAENKGSLARGARYNSAIKYLSYLHKKSQKAMILVISEDGSVDICSTDDVEVMGKD